MGSQPGLVNIMTKKNKRIILFIYILSFVLVTGGCIFLSIVTGWYAGVLVFAVYLSSFTAGGIYIYGEYFHQPIPDDLQGYSMPELKQLKDAVQFAIEHDENQNYGEENDPEGYLHLWNERLDDVISYRSKIINRFMN
jgi:hypothetical protein